MYLFADLWLFSFIAGFSILAVITASMGSLLLLGLSVISFIALADFFFDISVLEIITTNPQLVVPALAGYILLGIGYAGIWKWPKHIYYRGDDIQKYFVDYCKLKKMKQTSDAFDEFTRSGYYLNRFGIGAHKEILTVWVMLWPFTLLWELSHKPFIWVWSNVYNAIAEKFTKIGTKVAKKHIKFDE